jgi:hypothetical protein
MWNRSWIYPDYVAIIGRAFKAPHPHRHYTFEEFVDKLHSDPEFRKKLYETSDKEYLWNN